MKIIKLNGQDWSLDDMWNEKQQERADNLHVLSFFVLQCTCSCHTLIELEARTDESVNMGQVHIKCPNCATKLTITAPCNPDGVKVRVLESWHRKLKVSGLDLTDTKGLKHQLEQAKLALYQAQKELNELKRQDKYFEEQDKEFFKVKNQNQRVTIDPSLYTAKAYRRYQP